MKTKLKPCPFCGSTDVDFIGSDSSASLWYYCENSNCSCIGPNAKTERGARRLWNKRVPERKGAMAKAFEHHFGKEKKHES